MPLVSVFVQLTTTHIHEFKDYHTLLMTDSSNCYKQNMINYNFIFIILQAQFHEMIVVYNQFHIFASISLISCEYIEPLTAYKCL